MPYVGRERAAQEHKDGDGTKLLDDIIQEDDDDVAYFLAEAIDRAVLVQLQEIHGQANADGQEHNGQDGVVDTHGGADVRRNNVQDHNEGIAAGLARMGLKAADFRGERARAVEKVADGPGQEETDAAGHEEPGNGFPCHAAQGGRFADFTESHDDGREDHRHDNQLERTDEKLPADVEQANRLVGALRRDVLEQDAVDQFPRFTGRPDGLAVSHADQAEDNAQDHGHEHADGQLVVLVHFCHSFSSLR